MMHVSPLVKYVVVDVASVKTDEQRATVKNSEAPILMLSSADFERLKNKIPSENRFSRGLLSNKDIENYCLYSPLLFLTDDLKSEIEEILKNAC